LGIRDLSSLPLRIRSSLVIGEVSWFIFRGQTNLQISAGGWHRVKGKEKQKVDNKGHHQPLGDVSARICHAIDRRNRIRHNLRSTIIFQQSGVFKKI
jgi:hypothetical protein